VDIRGASPPGRGGCAPLDPERLDLTCFSPMPDAKDFG
jgi:hypothetical protein